MPDLPELSLSEWAVLGALSTGAAHGFAAARLLAPNGSLGRIWTVSRPLVYRAVHRLVDEQLVNEVGRVPSEAGPQRRLLELSGTGRAALAGWLAVPVAHVRGYRSELMLKLLLLESDPVAQAALAEAQRVAIRPICEGLRHKMDASVGFDAILSRWRLANAEAAADFLDDLRSHQQDRK